MTIRVLSDLKVLEDVGRHCDALTLDYRPRGRIFPCEMADGEVKDGDPSIDCSTVLGDKWTKDCTTNQGLAYRWRF